MIKGVGTDEAEILDRRCTAGHDAVGNDGLRQGGGSPAGQMVDGPGMMYTPEDQSPFAGSWQSRDGTIILEVESRGSLRRPAYRCL